MGSTKWTCHKERSFARSSLFFWKFCFSIRTCYKELIWSSNYPNICIHTFRKRWSFHWGCFFLVSILKTYSADATIRSDLNTNIMCHESSFVVPVCTLKLQRTDRSYLKKLLEKQKLLRCCSSCKWNDMQTWFSLLCQHIPHSS